MKLDGAADYDQCILFESPEFENSPRIKGQFCWMDTPRLLRKGYEKDVPDSKSNDSKKSTYPKMNKKTFIEIVDLIYFHDDIGVKSSAEICLPIACKPQDVENALNKGIDFLKISLHLG